MRLADHLSFGGGLVGSLGEFALLELGSGSDESDQVRRVDRAPPVLCGLDQLEGHRDARGARTGAFGDALPQPDGGEGGLDRGRGAQVDPVLSRVVVEGEQNVEVLGDLRDGLGPLDPAVGGERLRGGFGVLLVLDVPDLCERSLGAGSADLGRLLSTLAILVGA